MNWGFKISILYGGFILLIVTMVTLSMKQKVDLVSEDYYQQELDFQHKINQIERTEKLATPLTWKVTRKQLELQFPAEFSGKSKQGKIFFFRPSDAVLDQEVSLTKDTATLQQLSLKQLKKGVYKMQVNWEVNNSEFYNEGFIQIQ
jgi:hypothetical protein